MTDMLTSLGVSTRDLGGAVELECPRCRASLLHHGAVKVFDRHEDAASVTMTTVSGGTVSMATVGAVGSGNPSSRRDGLSIRFWCEGCGGDTPDDVIELTIAQHKGATEIGWRFTPRKQEA